MPAHSVLLVEDDPATRSRLAAVIGGHPQLSLLAAVGDCAGAFEQLRRQRPQVLLTDIGLPDGSGVELIAAVRAAHPEVECMAISIFGDERHVVEAISAGANGYLLKDDAPEAIGKAVLQLLGGGAPISPEIGRFLLDRARTPHAEPLAGESPFTSREREVLELVELGYSYQEIADQLGLSFHTVNAHIKHIYRKLQANSRGSALRSARRRGLLRPVGKREP